jgi:hypothetical protein
MAWTGISRKGMSKNCYSRVRKSKEKESVGLFRCSELNIPVRIFVNEMQAAEILRMEQASSIQSRMDPNRLK